MTTLPIAPERYDRDDQAFARQTIERALTSLESRQEANARFLKLASYAVADLPAAANYPQRLVYVTNGDAGVPCLGVSDGSTWRRISFGATVSET